MQSTRSVYAAGLGLATLVTLSIGYCSTGHSQEDHAAFASPPGEVIEGRLVRYTASTMTLAVPQATSQGKALPAKLVIFSVLNSAEFCLNGATQQLDMLQQLEQGTPTRAWVQKVGNNYVASRILAWNQAAIEQTEGQSRRAERATRSALAIATASAGGGGGGNSSANEGSASSGTNNSPVDNVPANAVAPAAALQSLSLDVLSTSLAQPMQGDGDTPPNGGASERSSSFEQGLMRDGSDGPLGFAMERAVLRDDDAYSSVVDGQLGNQLAGIGSSSPLEGGNELELPAGDSPLPGDEGTGEGGNLNSAREFLGSSSPRALLGRSSDEPNDSREAPSSPRITDPRSSDPDQDPNEDPEAYEPPENRPPGDSPQGPANPPRRIINRVGAAPVEDARGLLAGVNPGAIDNPLGSVPPLDGDAIRNLDLGNLGEQGQEGAIAHLNAGLLNDGNSNRSDGALNRPLVRGNVGVVDSANRQPTGRIANVSAGLIDSGNRHLEDTNPLVNANTGLLRSGNRQTTGRIANVNTGLIDSANNRPDGNNPLVSANTGLARSANKQSTGRIANVNTGLVDSGNGNRDGVNPLVNVNSGLIRSGNKQPTGRVANVNAGLIDSGNSRPDGTNPLVNVNAGLVRSGNKQPTGKIVNVNAGLVDSGNGPTGDTNPLVNVNAGLVRSGNKQPTGSLVDVNLQSLSSGEGNAGEIGSDVAESVTQLLRGPVHEAFARPLVGEVIRVATSPIEPPVDVREVLPSDLDLGDLQHIPGYWCLDAVTGEFVWVTGVLRKAPTGMVWNAGRWARSQTGFVRVPGFWKPVGAVRKTKDLLESEILTPETIVETLQGSVPIESFVDHAIEHRGVLLAPVRFAKSALHEQNVLHLVDCEPIALRNLLMHLFVDKVRDEFHFGDYYGEDGKIRQLVPWHKTGQAAGTLLAQYQELHSQLVGVDFVSRLKGWALYCEENPEHRPPQTLQAAVRRIQSQGDASLTSVVILSEGALSHLLATKQSLHEDLSLSELSSTVEEKLHSNDLKSSGRRLVNHLVPGGNAGEGPLPTQDLGAFLNGPSQKLGALGGHVGSSLNGLTGKLQGVGGGLTGGLGNAVSGIGVSVGIGGSGGSGGIGGSAGGGAGLGGGGSGGLGLGGTIGGVVGGLPLLGK